jgi:hypothetical protein
MNKIGYIKEENEIFKNNNNNNNNNNITISNCSSLKIDEEITSNTLNVIMPTLHILTIFKSFLSMDEMCHNVNEILIIDTETGRFRCICMEGKSCDDNNSFETVLKVLVGISVAVFVFIIVVIIKSLKTMRERQDAMLRDSKKKIMITKRSTTTTARDIILPI